VNGRTAKPGAGVGKLMVLDQNRFIETALPRTTLSGIADNGLPVYRSPYPRSARGH
jgi:hypothetical protein